MTNEIKKMTLTVVVTLVCSAMIAAAKAYVDVEKIKTEVVGVYRSLDQMKDTIDNVANDVKIIKEYLINKRN